LSDYESFFAMNTIRLGIYRHYKGNLYEVTGFAKHSETLEDMVVYKALYGERGTWVRPLPMWENQIEVEGDSTVRREDGQTTIIARPRCGADK
jgi:hypothetical protein